MKVLRAILILAALGAPLRALAESKWWCSTNIRARGNAHYFLLYGRDAWEGEGDLFCSRPGQNINQKVRFGFYSKNTGFGANDLSIIGFTLTFWTDSHPSDLKFFATLPGLADGSMVHWQAAIGSVELTASAWTQSSQATTDSLSLGTFDLRALESKE